MPDPGSTWTPVPGAVLTHDAGCLPEFTLSADDELGAALRGLGAATFREAARRVRALPYGRNADRGDYRLVLTEGQGTCSTKHALLAAVARTHRAPVRLALGIYEMSEANTPGIAAALARYGIDRVPEAHCYLRSGAHRVDLTRSPKGPAEPIAGLLGERDIEPHEIGAEKVRLHRAFLREWLARSELAPRLDAETLWSAREACIAALAAAAG